MVTMVPFLAAESSPQYCLQGGFGEAPLRAEIRGFCPRRTGGGDKAGS